MNNEEIIEQLRKNEAALRTELNRTKGQVAVNNELVLSLFAALKSEQEARDQTNSISQVSEELPAILTDNDRVVVEQIQDVDMRIVENREQIEQNQQELRLINGEVVGSYRNLWDPENAANRPVVEPPFKEDITVVYEKKDLLSTIEDKPVSEYLKVLLAIRFWEVENLSLEEYSNKENHYYQIRENWKQIKDRLGLLVVLKLDTTQFLPLVEERAITLHPVIHARLIERITTTTDFYNLHVRDPKRDTDKSVIWPRLRDADYIETLEIMVENQDENLQKFVSQFPSLNTLIIRCRAGYENSLDFLTNSSPEKFCVLYKTSDEKTKEMLDFFVEMCESLASSTVIFNPVSTRCIEEHLSSVAEPSRNVTKVLMRVSMKNKPVFDQFVKRVNLKKITVEGNGEDEDSNIIEIKYSWSQEFDNAHTRHRRFFNEYLKHEAA